MRSSWFKYLLIICLLTTYINRGLFISLSEPEYYSTSTSSDKGEINSVLEFLNWILSGQENKIDEDGNTPESYNFVKISHSLIAPDLFHSIEFNEPPASNRNVFYPLCEAILSSALYCTIDHPPEKA